MKINKTLLMAHLFAMLPCTMTSANAHQQLRTINDIPPLEYSPECDVVQADKKENKTKTLDSSALLEIFLVVGGLGLFSYIAQAFGDMEKLD